METENAEAEESQFSNIPETRQRDMVHSYKGDEFVVTNNRQPLGAAFALNVNKGDVVDLSVYGKTVIGGGEEGIAGIEAVAGALFGALTNQAITIGENANAVSSGLMDGLELLGFGASDNKEATGYLNYLLFDKSFSLITGGFSPVTASSYEKKAISDIMVEQPGYLITYLSYESSAPDQVLFDDFSVTLETSTVIQQDDYYPFGGTFNSYTSGTENLYKYNNKEEQKELGTYDYGWRQYDPWLGRFNAVDAFAEKYYDLTPYHYGANNPILYVDINGDSIDVSNLSKEARAQYDAQISKLSENKMFKAYYETLQNSETTYIIKSGGGHGGSGSFNPETGEVHANMESAYAISQELFHAFQSDLGVYSSEDRSVRETEGDIVSGNIALSIGEISISDKWDPGIGFKYSDNDLNFNNSVFSKEFDADFNKAVDARISFYKNREAVDGAEAPKGYVQKNSGVGALALKRLVQMVTGK